MKNHSARMSATEHTHSSLQVINGAVANGGSAKEAPREHFTSKYQYLMTSISYSVGLGNVWRFPYLCYKNGGGSFLVPFFLSMFFLGLTYFFFESVVGQYTGFGPMEVWKIAPIMSGISFASMVLVCLLSIYYNVLIAWSLYFFYQSFSPVVPWSHCHTAACVDPLLSANGTVVPSGSKPLTPSADYFFNIVLDVTDSVSSFDAFRPHLVLCLAVAWLIVFASLAFGAKFLGKISTFTTVFPYVMLTALIVQGCSLEGAADGIVHYLKPDFAKLWHTKVWADAGSQIFYSMSICMGGVITLASYNQFHNNTLRDSVIIVSINSFTSIISGFAIFSVIGYLAHQLGEPVASAVDGGVGLAFVAYPAALARMPGAPFWSAVFFLMLIALGFGSQFTLVETAVTNVVDFFPSQLRRRKPLVLAAVCVSFFIAALPMCTGAGYYVLQLVDTYAANYSVFALGVCEAVAFGWFYGADRILGHFRVMAGHDAPFVPYWRVMIRWVCPVVISLVLVLTFANFEPLSTVVKGRLYSYPLSVESVGFAMSALSVAMVPLFAVRQCLRVRRGQTQLAHIFRAPCDYNNNPQLTRHELTKC